MTALMTSTTISALSISSEAAILEKIMTDF
jgi:hypothetical protein